MKPLAFCLVFAVCLQAQAPMTDQRVIELVQAGVKPDELARVIANAPDVSFDLTPAAEDQMLKAGVSEDAIRVMAARAINGPAMLARPVQPVAAPMPKHRHSARYWVIVGVAAGGIGYLTYWAATRSNPAPGCCQNPFP